MTDWKAADDHTAALLKIADAISDAAKAIDRLATMQLLQMEQDKHPRKPKPEFAALSPKS